MRTAKFIATALTVLSANAAHAAAPIYNDFFSKITDPLESAITSTSSSVATAITPTATTLFLIYICFWAWALARGIIQEPILDGVQRLVRWSLIYSIGLVATHYATFVINFFWNAPDAMASVIVSGFDGGGTISGSVNTMNFLDRMLSGYYLYHQRWWDHAYKNANNLGIPNLGQIIMSYIIFIVGVLVTAIAAFFVLLAKVAMAILLGIGPIAIIMLFFNSTSKLFDSWLGQVINYLLVGVLIAATLAVVGGPLFEQVKTACCAIDPSTGLPPAQAPEPLTGDAIVIIALSLVSIFFFFLIPGIASAIGGGVALQTMGAVGWAYARAKGAAGGAAREVSGRAHNDRLMRRAQVARARQYNRQNPGLIRRSANAVGARVSSAVRSGNAVKKA